MDLLQHPISTVASCQPNKTWHETEAVASNISLEHSLLVTSLTSHCCLRTLKRRCRSPLKEKERLLTITH